MRLSRSLAATGLCLAATLPATGEQVISDTLIVSGPLCAGAGCAAGEIFTGGTVKIKQNAVRLHFDDASAIAQTDWQIEINDGSQTGPSYFAINDLDAGTTPFAIDAGAPSSAFRIDNQGWIGIGTAFPEEEVHILGDRYPGILFEATNLEGVPFHRWLLDGGFGSFSVIDTTETAWTYPFYIYTGTESHALGTRDDAVFVGTPYPKAKLHVDLDPDDATYPYAFVVGDGDIGADIPSAMAQIMSGLGNAQLRIEENVSVTNPRTLLNLTNNGRPEIIMANTATNGEWSFGAGTDFFLKVGTVGSVSGEKAKVFTVKNNGDAIVFGTLTTGGTTCGTGCDRVFDTDYELPTIADHAARMKTLGHLPNVGPTVEGQPFNLTRKVGGILNELEHAHLYIAALEADKTALATRVDALEKLVADLAADRH